MKKRNFLIKILMIAIVIICIAIARKTYEPKEYVIYTVCKGDTLWDISNRVKLSEHDTREVIELIKYKNKIGTDLTPGMELEIPVF